jgi:type VI protein secretion system component VasK
MLRRFLNTRVSSIVCMAAFIGCCVMFCVALAGARDSAEFTSEITRQLLIWGVLTLVAMLAFCLCLARVTRYRRGLPDKHTSKMRA